MKKFIAVASIIGSVACGKGNNVTGISEEPTPANTYSDGEVEASAYRPSRFTCGFKASIIIPGELIKASGYWTYPNAFGKLTKVNTNDRVITIPTSPFNMLSVPIHGTNKLHTLRLDIVNKNGDIFCTKTISPVTQ